MSPADSEKRQVPGPLKALLEQDKVASKQVFEYFSRQYGMENYRHYLKWLEYSCHGIPWLVGNFAMMYMFKENMELWVNLTTLLVIDIVIVAIIKAFSRRRRPSYNQMDMFATVSVDKFSFPSGHSTRAVALALFFFSLWPIFLPLRLILLPWAVAVCVSRVLLGRHHILDVLAGAIVGYLEYLIIQFVWINEAKAGEVGEYFFGDDPWSNA